MRTTSLLSPKNSLGWLVIVRWRSVSLGCCNSMVVAALRALPRREAGGIRIFPHDRCMFENRRSLLKISFLVLRSSSNFVADKFLKLTGDFEIDSNPFIYII